MFFDTNFLIVCLYFLAVFSVAPSSSPFRSLYDRLWTMRGRNRNSEVHKHNVWRQRDTHSLAPKRNWWREKEEKFMFFRNRNWNFFTSDSGWRGVAAERLVCGGYKFRNIKNFNLKPFTAYILIELQFYFNKMRWRNDVSLFRSDGRIELISGFHLEWMMLMLRSISPSAGNRFMMNCRESLESPSMCHKFSHSALRNPPAQRVVN